MRLDPSQDLERSDVRSIILLAILCEQGWACSGYGYDFKRQPFVKGRTRVEGVCLEQKGFIVS